MSIICCETLLHNCYQSPWFLLVRDCCFQTCLLHLTRFYVCLLESSHFPVVWRGEHIHALIQGVSGCDFQSSSFSYSARVYYSPAWYYKITMSLIIHATSFWKFLKKQDSLIDAVGKVWHCSVNRSIGTSLLLDSFVTADAIWRTYHQLTTHTPTNEANYVYIR